MPMKLFYITNNPDIAKIAENAGVDRIFVDLEYIGKEERQGNLDTVKSCHTIDDVGKIRDAIERADVLVRINPIHDNTIDEIEKVIDNGADIIMLPYFKTIEEVDKFISITQGRAKTMLLVETPEAVAKIDEILSLHGINEVFIGLNDLSLGYGKNFMFELLADGTVEKLCHKFKMHGLFYGFGGIARLGCGLLPAENIIKEHYRLGSTMAILSRSFCDVGKFDDLNAIRTLFYNGVREIRVFEEECEKHFRFFSDNEREVHEAIHAVMK